MAAIVLDSLVKGTRVVLRGDLSPWHWSPRKGATGAVIDVIYDDDEADVVPYVMVQFDGWESYYEVIPEGLELEGDK